MLARTDAIFQPAHQFFKQATSTAGIMASVCSLNPSGCHAFAATLKAYFPALDYIEIKVSRDLKDDTTEMTPRSSIQHHAATWNYMVITGCGIISRAAFVTDKLIEKYFITTLSHVYILAPPHLSGRYLKEYVIKSSEYQRAFRDFSCSVSLLTSGVDCKHESAMGLPLPMSMLDSKLVMSESCYGLMYIRHLPILQSTDENKFLNAYFLQVRAVSKKDIEIPITIMAIKIDEINKIVLENIAAKYNIKIIFSDELLSKADFIQIIRLIAEKRGYMATDGTQTLIQALYLGASALFVNKKNNESFCQQLIAFISPDYRHVAEVVLGQRAHYNVLADDKAFQLVCEALQKLLHQSVKQFEQNKASMLLNDSERDGFAANSFLRKRTKSELDAKQSLDESLVPRQIA